MPDPVDEISSACLAVRVRMLHRAVSAIYDRALAKRDLTVAQLNILVFVGRAGPCAPGDVGRMLHMERSTVSRNLKPIVERGWLSAELDDGGRVREIALTGRGRQKLESALPDWRAAQEEAEALIGAGGSQALRTLGERLWRQAGA